MRCTSLPLTRLPAFWGWLTVRQHEHLMRPLQTLRFILLSPGAPDIPRHGWSEANSVLCWLQIYRQLFAWIVAGNLAILVAAAAGAFPWAFQHRVQFAAANILIAVLARNEVSLVDYFGMNNKEVKLLFLGLCLVISQRSAL